MTRLISFLFPFTEVCNHNSPRQEKKIKNTQRKKNAQTKLQ